MAWRPKMGWDFIRGDRNVVTDDLETLLKCGKMELIAHSHPDIEKIIPSSKDRRFLKEIGQEKSIIISWYTGQQVEFYADEFVE